MKTPLAVLSRILLFLLVLAVGTMVTFFILEIVAIPIPALQSYLACPQETTIQYRWVQESSNQPGETTLEKSCLTHGGKQMIGFSDDVYFQRENDLFLPLAFAFMLIGESSGISLYNLRKTARCKNNLKNGQNCSLPEVM